MMDKIVYIYYFLLAVFLFRGVKLYGKRSWNDEFLSLSQTKSLQGFCAICIMLHHIGQKTCAPWLKPEVQVHGLELFVPIGYFFVGIFLFCSGYGLYKSFKQKPDYLNGFLGRRILPLVVAYYSTGIIFVIVRCMIGEKISREQILIYLLGFQSSNPYSWFVITLIFLYLVFYFVFKYFKNEKIALLVTCLAVLLYMGHCEWWMYGEWWYNSVLLFVVGVLFARYEVTIVKEIKKRYALYVIMSLVSLTSFYILSELTKEALTNYEADRWICLLAQMIASCSFVLAVFLLGMKIKIGNKALAFMGTMTLEFYLIHGLFIQLFGFSFNDTVNSLYYIRNVVVLVLVVFVLSLPSAFYLHKFDKWMVLLLVERMKKAKYFQRKLKRLVLVMVGIFIIITLVVSADSHIRSIKMKETVNEYKENNITFAEVDGKKMAAYITGQGDHTIVLLGLNGDPCPTITLKPLAKRLEKKNRVIILDYFGCGFSEATDSKRTADRLVYEIHTALSSLGEKGPFIFMPHYTSGIYTQLYSYTYPDEVEAVIGIDSSVAEQMLKIPEIEGISPQEYKTAIKKDAILQYRSQKVLSITGYDRIIWQRKFLSITYEAQFPELEATVLQEVATHTLNNATVRATAENDFDNHCLLLNKKYEENLPVLFILAFGSCKGSMHPDLDWKQIHEDLLTNPDIQKVLVMVGGNYSFIYRNPKGIAEKAQEFIDKMDLKSFEIDK